MYTMEEAFKALRSGRERKALKLNEQKLSYRGFEDLFDQVYCTITHGGDLGFDRKGLGDLGKFDIKYDDDQIEIDYGPKGGVIIVTDTRDRISNAITIAEIYNLEHTIDEVGDNIRVKIYIPDNKPVNRSVFGYKDTEGKLKRIVNYDMSNRKNKDKVPVNASFESSTSKETIEEDVESSMPTDTLPVSDIYNFVDALPEATNTRPPQPFKLGYIRELKAEVSAKYRGGKDSDGQPYVRIFKASEYSKLYTKAPYENLGSTKAYRKETGKEAGRERTGFHSNNTEAGNILNAIGSYANGDTALQAYPMRDNKIKVAYFISIDDADLVPATKEDVARYLTPYVAAKVLGLRPADEMTKSADNINRFKLTGIYMIGNLGHSIIR